MKLAHLSKPWLPVPSEKYGAIEKMLAELILKQQHKISLFAPDGSLFNDKISLFPLYPEGQGDKGLDRNTELAQAVHCVINAKKQSIDIIHAHSVDPFLGLTPFIKIPSVFTFYSNPTPAGKILSQLSLDHTTFTFLSHSHSRSFPWIKDYEVIYFGIDPNNFPFSEEKEDYLAFVGTISDKKGILEAIRIAEKSEIKLKIAAKIRDKDSFFYESKVRKQINSSRYVEFIGEINNEERNNMLKKACALIFPIKWEEPFGRVMIESLVVGTPVIAFRRGSVPEIVQDGKNGFIVENVEEAVEKIQLLDQISPKYCRISIEKNFHIETTVKEFDKLYQRIIQIEKNGY